MHWMGLVIVGLMFAACGSNSNSDNARKPTPAEAFELSKEERSSCNYCGSGGYMTDPSRCEAGEVCLGVGISVQGAPITVASCQRRFKDDSGKEYSYTCRKQKN